MSNKINKAQTTILNFNSIKKLSDNTFRIRINIQLRCIGIREILLDPEEFSIISDDFDISVPHHYDVEEVIYSTEDQLLDPIHNLPGYTIKKIIEYLYSVWNEIDAIFKYFKWKFENK